MCSPLIGVFVCLAVHDVQTLGVKEAWSGMNISVLFCQVSDLHLCLALANYTVLLPEALPILPSLSQGRRTSLYPFCAIRVLYARQQSCVCVCFREKVHDRIHRDKRHVFENRGSRAPLPYLVDAAAASWQTVCVYVREGGRGVNPCLFRLCLYVRPGCVCGTTLHKGGHCLFGCMCGGGLFCFNHLWKSCFFEVVNALPVALSFPLPWIAMHKQPFIPLTPHLCLHKNCCYGSLLGIGQHVAMSKESILCVHVGV